MILTVLQRMLEVDRLSALKLPMEDFAGKVVPLLAEVIELGGWIVDPKNAPNVSEKKASFESWVSLYVSNGVAGIADFTDKLTRACLRKPRGRPAERKLSAVGALEAKLANPRLSWEDLAESFYPSPKDANIDSPAQALRQEVIALRKILKKYAIPGWQPFERHPGAKKSRKTTPK